MKFEKSSLIFRGFTIYFRNVKILFFFFIKKDFLLHVCLYSLWLTVSYITHNAARSDRLQKLRPFPQTLLITLVIS